MNHRKVIVAGFVILLLAAGGFAVAQTEPGGAGEAADNRTITVRATADAAAPPDLALVRVAVVETAPDADAARQRVATNASELRAALRELGIEDDQVRTTYVHLGPVEEGAGDGRSVAGYRAAHGFEIEAPVDRAGAVIDAAVSNGSNRVDGVTFTLTDETRRRLRASALGHAMDDARADAEVIAAASDVTIAGVQSATTADVSYVAAGADLAGARAGEEATAVDPGPVTVSATVSVTYRVE